jgi:hypothetical protein
MESVKRADAASKVAEVGGPPSPIFADSAAPWALETPVPATTLIIPEVSTRRMKCSRVKMEIKTFPTLSFHTPRGGPPRLTDVAGPVLILLFLISAPANKSIPPVNILTTRILLSDAVVAMYISVTLLPLLLLLSIQI